jgi:nitrogen fixation/metabolism regulation signal transduction histidine kinase
MSAGGDPPARIGELVVPENMAQVLVQLSITLAIGVLIVGKVFNALPKAETFSAAATQVETITATAFELAPVILIVIVSAVVISVVRRI